MDSSQPFIPDELLSAYIDGEISEAERTQIETALAADESVAWRLQTLRQMVRLLNELPGVAAPRSFALRADEVSEVIARRQQAARAVPTQATGGAGLWQALRALWQSGSPLWRNAAATSLALFLALIVVEQATPVRIGLEQGEFATVSQVSNAGASQAAPAADAAADAAAEQAAVEDMPSEDTANEEVVEADASAQDEALVEQAAGADADNAAEAAPEAEMLLTEESAESEGDDVAAAAASADTSESLADAGDGATADLDAAAPASAAEAAAMALPTVRNAEAFGFGEAGGGNTGRDEIEGGEALGDVEVEAPGVAADAAVMSQAAPAAARRAPVEAFSATREVAADEASVSSASAPTVAAASAAEMLLTTDTAFMTDAEITVIEALTDADSASPTDTLLMADAPASPLLPSVAVVTNVVTSTASSTVANSTVANMVTEMVTETGEVAAATAERGDSSREVAATVTAAPTPATFSERAVDIDTYAERNLLSLQTAQLAAGLLALALGLLWLRSRERK